MSETKANTCVIKYEDQSYGFCANWSHKELAEKHCTGTCWYTEIKNTHRRSI